MAKAVFVAFTKESEGARNLFTRRRVDARTRQSGTQQLPDFTDGR